MADACAAPGAVPGAVFSCDAASSSGRVAAVFRDLFAMGNRSSSRRGERVRWPVFVSLSLALHGTLVLTAPRTTGESPLGPSSFPRPLAVQLVAIPGSDAMPSRTPVESEWTELQPLPVPRHRPMRMLEFVPIDPLPADIDESAYLPISRVTLRPIPVTPIAVPYPTGVEVSPSTEAKIVLFIDEDGGVAKVMFAKDQAPTPFAMSAKATFERVRYRSALLDGRAVKVRMVVAVTFEDREAKRSRGSN